uniref:T-lymphocyte activation antigen CD80 n=1 Tax=Urocitellus parryii TaxID=9999 RepID=A0A8D2IEZ5_UROPR
MKLLPLSLSLHFLPFQLYSLKQGLAVFRESPKWGPLAPFESPHFPMKIPTVIKPSSCISQVTKTVQGMAKLSCNYNISVDELSRVRIYWQKENKMVLSVISGRVQVWSQYQNRTIPEITNNLSLVILALRLSDRGTYTCVVQKTKKGSFQVEHLTSVMLSIKADFPTPSITDSEHPSPDLRRITCSTSGGFPKPYLFWLENGEEVKAVNTTVYQDPETELYTVYSNLDFNVTSNHSFVCLIKYGDLSVSQIFNWEKPPLPKIHFVVCLIRKTVPSKIFSGLYFRWHTTSF